MDPREDGAPRCAWNDQPQPRTNRQKRVGSAGLALTSSTFHVSRLSDAGTRIGTTTPRRAEVFHEQPIPPVPRGGRRGLQVCLILFVRARPMQRSVP